jgi:hypothetical protein
VPALLREQDGQAENQRQAQSASRLLAELQKVHVLVGDGESPALVGEDEVLFVGGGYGSFGVGRERGDGAAAVDRLIAGDAAQQSRRNGIRKENHHHEKGEPFHGRSPARIPL